MKNANCGEILKKFEKPIALIHNRVILQLQTQ